MLGYFHKYLITQEYILSVLKNKLCNKNNNYCFLTSKFKKNANVKNYDVRLNKTQPTPAFGGSGVHAPCISSGHLNSVRDQSVIIFSLRLASKTSHPSNMPVSEGKMCEIKMERVFASLLFFVFFLFSD